LFRQWSERRIRRDQSKQSRRSGATGPDREKSHAEATIRVLTEAEQRIMRVLWDKGEASVRDVTDALEDSYPVAYNTVLTLLRILTDKDYVKPRQDGRAFIYTPVVSRADARSRALRKMVSTFFEGSPTELRSISSKGVSVLTSFVAEERLEDLPEDGND
jgi:predicted transcriptional regulator